MRKEINDRVANKLALDAHIFDAAQKEVEDLVRDSAYANFLNSDVYLSYIQVAHLHDHIRNCSRSIVQQRREGYRKSSVDIRTTSRLGVSI